MTIIRCFDRTGGGLCDGDGLAGDQDEDIYSYIVNIVNHEEQNSKD